jgi:hypothetical protein
VPQGLRQEMALPRVFRQNLESVLKEKIGEAKPKKVTSCQAGL